MVNLHHLHLRNTIQTFKLRQTEVVIIYITHVILEKTRSHELLSKLNSVHVKDESVINYGLRLIKENQHSFIKKLNTLFAILMF